MHVFKWPPNVVQHHVFILLLVLFLLHRGLSLGSEPNNLIFLLLADKPRLPPKSSSNSPGRIIQAAFSKMPCVRLFRPGALTTYL